MSRAISSLLIAFALLAAVNGKAQKADTASLHEAVATLHMALMHKDKKYLMRLLGEGLTYGHSNGWIENRDEVMADLFNGKLDYEEIVPLAETLAVDGTTGVVRMKGLFKIRLDRKPMTIKLGVLQVWTWKKKHWVLMSRQSVQLEG